MKNKKPNAELSGNNWKIKSSPACGCRSSTATVYSHLLRHSRLEGKLRLRFSNLGLGRNTRLSTGPVRDAVCRLVAHGALRMIQRSKAGHVVEVRLPGEIRALRLNHIESEAAKETSAGRQRTGEHRASRLSAVQGLPTTAIRIASASLLKSGPRYPDFAMSGTYRYWSQASSSRKWGSTGGRCGWPTLCDFVSYKGWAILCFSTAQCLCV